MAPPKIDVMDRLRARSSVSQSGCHIWLGAKVYGYGQISVNRKTRRVHRVAYEILVGPIPEGMQIDHKCKTRACWNPNHLQVVTARENTLLSDAPSAWNLAKTHCHKGHPFAGDNLGLREDGTRYCRTCNNGFKRARRRKNAALLGREVRPMPPDRSHCPEGHELAGENLYRAPNGSRACRSCRLRRSHEAYLKVKAGRWR